MTFPPGFESVTGEEGLTAAAAEARATDAAEAAAQVLPSVDPLMAGPAQPGSPHVTSVFAGAAVADLEPHVGGRLAVLVGRDLVDALESGPLGGLDLHAAIQPSLDAAAARLGSRARNARTVALEDVVEELGDEFTTIPLIGSGIAAAALITNRALTNAGAPVAEAEPAPGAQPVVHAEIPPQAASVPAPSPGPTAAVAAAAAAMAGSGFAASPAYSQIQGQRGLEMLHGVDMEVTVELGRTRMTVRDLLALAPGAVLELDRAAGSPADLLVNGRLIARGEVVVVDEDFGLRVTEILDDTAAV